ncbi:MAG TPA: SDR family NAD(P)-dependent oxidoreductase, partial [Kofleriaceae bacterium]|nr:SDR family NAD(P)-dependent oxidoreductase [Kofleriaceae bacterium]
ITGGLGELSLELAEALAAAVRARLVLTTTGAWPARADWDRPELDARSRARIARVKKLEALGAEVVVAQADSANAAAMAGVIADARARFGRIDGVIHAAGLTSRDAFVPFAGLTAADLERHLAPKARGLIVLADLLEHEPPDFVLALSSVASLLGGIGFAGYAAANRFVEAFVEAQRRRGLPWLAIGWSEWASAAGRRVTGAASDVVLSVAAGLDSFTRALASLRADGELPWPRLLVSPIDIASRLAPLGAAAAPDAPAAARAQPARKPRPVLREVHVAPRDQVERDIAELWESFLGVDGVGMNDNFFELGGDSVLGVELIAQLMKRLGVQLAAVDLFESPTIGTLADIVRSGRDADRHQLAKSGDRGNRRREQQDKARRQRDARNGEPGHE